jgi:hypothetical protein
MNENNKSFYPSDVFEFIHHSKYGCHDLKGLNASWPNATFIATMRVVEDGESLCAMFRLFDISSTSL